MLPRRSRTVIAILCEPLEPRQMLHALPDGTQVELSVKINFQPARAPVPAGYLVDAGDVFGDRGNGLSYGWDQDNRTSTRDRGDPASPDQRYDTFTHTQRYGTRTWQIAVADGDYAVRVVAGDPTAFNSVYAFNVEGVPVVAGKPTTTARWLDGTKIVTVADGRLTLSNAAAADNNKVAFVEITSVQGEPPPATTVTVAASDAAAGEPTASSGANPGIFQITRAGPATQPLTVAYTLGGTATAGVDYPPLFGSVTIPPGASSATITVTPLADALVEGDETVALSLAAGAGYVLASPSGAVVTIADANAQPPAPSPAGWQTAAPSPVARFESPSASVNGKLYVFGGYDKNILAMSRSDVYDPAADRWTRLADMPQPITHAGVATDGPYVYLAGGFVGERSFAVTANVWRYDTRSNIWSALTPLPAPRAAGGLVRVGRKLYYFAGTDERQQQDFGDTWVFDLDAPAGSAGASWQALAPLPRPRNHVGYATVNGKVYCIGGQVLADEKLGNIADVNVYDPATNRWTTGASLPMPLSHVHTATVVLNNRIITAGGNTNDPYFPKTVADVLSYDPASNTWVELPPLPDVRQAAVAQLVGDRLYVTTGTPTGIHPVGITWWRQMTNVWDAAPAMPVALGEMAGGVIGGKLYVVGDGSDATLAYDVTHGTWSSATALARRPYQGSDPAAEAVIGKLYLFGGAGGSSEGRVQIFDPASNKWTLGAPMPFAAAASSSAVIGGKVFVAGGTVAGKPTDRAACYDPAADTWTDLPALPRARDHAAGGTDGKRLFLFGGDGTDTVQVYNPATGQWWSSAIAGSTLRPMPHPRGGLRRAVFYNGEFYLAGGAETVADSDATSAGLYSRLDVYNPATNTWRVGPPMPTPRQGVFPLLLANRMYVAGGGTRSGASTSAVLEILDGV